MRKIKFLSILLFLIITLTSCFNSNEKNTENNKKINSEKITNEKKEISKMSDEELKQDIKEEVKKRIRPAEKLDKGKFNLDLKNCEWKKDSKICKSIVINMAWTKTKDINLCDVLWNKKDINKCKNKVILKLATKEMNPKYCEQLEKIDKKMCLEEYEDNIKIEVEMMKKIYSL